MPKSLICVLPIHLTIYLYALPLFISAQFEFRNFFLRFIISQHFSNMRLPSSSPKHNGHFFFPVSFLFPFDFHTPACNYDIQLLSFLEQQFMRFLLPPAAINLNSFISVNDIVIDISATVSCGLVLLHPSCTGFIA